MLAGDMSELIHAEAVELLLKAIDKNGDLRLSSFMFGEPGSPSWQKNLGAELWVHRKAYTKALIFIRQNGAPYLREISIGDIWSKVTNFLTENYWYIGKDTFFFSPNGSFDKHVSDAHKSALAKALANSPMFHPHAVLTLFPLVAVGVADSFECEQFFLVEAAGLNEKHLPHAVNKSGLLPASFPPISEWQGSYRSPAAWLGVRSPLLQVSRKLAAVILGAVALTPVPRQRFMCSGRQMFGGWCTVDRSYTISPGGDPHTPAMMDDIVIGAADHAWLNILSELLQKADPISRAMCRSLEYFYRAWFLDPRERFPALCMALDSLVCAPKDYTKAAIKFVSDEIGLPVNEERLRLLMRIRGAVIHGAAPDVYESSNYAQYYVDYGADPIFDLELVTARVLRNKIFKGNLTYHPDPNQNLIDQLKASGKLPKIFSPESIVPIDA